MWKPTVANGGNTEKGGHERTGPRSIRGLRRTGTRGDYSIYDVRRGIVCTIVHVTVCQWGLHRGFRIVRLGSDGDGDEDEDVRWERKLGSRRGRTTGMYASPDSWWVHGHRARLVTLAGPLEGNVSELPVPGTEKGSGAVGEPQTHEFNVDAHCVYRRTC